MPSPKDGLDPFNAVETMLRELKSDGTPDGLISEVEKAFDNPTKVRFFYNSLIAQTYINNKIAKTLLAIIKDEGVKKAEALDELLESLQLNLDLVAGSLRGLLGENYPSKEKKLNEAAPDGQ